MATIASLTILLVLLIPVVYSRVLSSPPTERSAKAEPVTNRKWVLRSRPSGDFRASDLQLKTEAVSADDLEKDEVLVEVETLSIEAFYRTTLDASAYHGSTDIGSVVPALGIGKVVASKSKKFKTGSRVVGGLGSQTISKISDATLQPAAALPGTKKTDALGRLGISGLTAWIGMIAVLGPPKKGQLVVVSAAAGAVGSLAAQIAKARGAKVIGIAGGASKCEYLKEKLGLYGAIDYKSKSLTVGEQLDMLAPDGVDFFFDNVGGSTLDAVLSRLKLHSRVVICGGISYYAKGDVNNGKVVGPSQYLKLAEKSSTMRGFNIMHYLPGKLLPFLAQMLMMIWRKRLVMDEHVEEGIEKFASAMELLQSGGHTGKLLVKVSE